MVEGDHDRAPAETVNYSKGVKKSLAELLSREPAHCS
jgi:hypothetical protein